MNDMEQVFWFGYILPAAIVGCVQLSVLKAEVKRDLYWMDRLNSDILCKVTVWRILYSILLTGIPIVNIGVVVVYFVLRFVPLFEIKLVPVFKTFFGLTPKGDSNDKRS